MKVTNVFRDEKDDMLNFQAVINLVSDPENHGITRLRFNELRILFSKTSFFSDENLNTKVSILIECQWHSIDVSPVKRTLIEQAHEFKNLKYGYYNQVKDPILSFGIMIFRLLLKLKKY